MEETEYHLPQMFFDGKSSPTNIYFYQTGKSSRNNKVKFSQNLICIMQAGEKEISGQTILEKFGSSNLYILSAGNVLMTETTTADDKYGSILLFFSNEYLSSFLHRNSLQLVKPQHALNCIKVTKDDYLLNYERSLEILKEQLLENQSLLYTKIDEILLYLLKKNPVQVNDLFKNIMNNDKNTSLTAVVQANLDNNLTIEELAFLCNMSASTFKRRFAEAYNTTPKQYFIEHKMQRALRLLQDNKKPSEIYFELGYEDISAFSNEFKKHFGVSPKEYITKLSV